MTNTAKEYVRGLLAQARARGVQDAQIKAGAFVETAQSMEDAVDELDVKGYPGIKASDLLKFVGDFLLAQTFSVADIVGITLTPIVPFVAPLSESCWLAYKQMLLSKPGFSEDSITETEHYARWVVDRLDVGQCNPHTPRRGLVMGSVQSGKTANMGAVMSMAADRGINLFIVYAGVLNSLRNQTMGRFGKDLQNSLTSQWHIFDFNEKGADFSDVHFETGSPARNLIVCLKNGTRLSRLGEALEKACVYKKSMRALIIDDEADQASPDTEDMTMTEEQELEERSKINKCIIKILFNRCTRDNSVSKHEYGAINYLCYTATPYANILNEAGKESLYPGDFVLSLPEPNNYFGIRAIFGDGNLHPHGLNVVRTISDDEASDAAEGDVSLGGETSLGKSLAWFFCSAAVLRTRNYRKPISMLVNPSARIAVHGAIDQTIIRWLKNIDDGDFLRLCKKVFDEESMAFTSSDLRNDYPGGYGSLKEIKDLPGFDSLREEILVLKGRIERITATAQKKLEYHEGLHVCVDNSASRAKSDKFFRIIYPDDATLGKLCKAPVFLVIGGSTLSRGLTLEGLCCSYFTRSVNQADTLMQMGRWFGYRKGYELLQRIWMTYSTQVQFRAMARMDMALKAELNRFRVDLTLDPSTYGPRVCNMPDAVHLRLASDKHMQHAEACDYDFSGAGYETTEFIDQKKVLESNNSVVQQFFVGLSVACSQTSRGSTGFVWRGVDSGKVLGLLSDYQILPKSTFAGDMKDFIPWMEAENGKGNYKKWNIALCGDVNAADKWSPIKSAGVGKIGRTRYVDTPAGVIDIGSFRSGLDALIDVDQKSLFDPQIRDLRQMDNEKKDLISGRGQLGLEDVPVLLVYAIDGRGNTKTRRTGRAPINVGCDIVGLAVIVSGSQANKSHVNSVRVRTKW